MWRDAILCPPHLSPASLSWVEPRHLSLPFLSTDPSLWSHSIHACEQIDIYHSPQQKLDCLILAIRWLAKMLQVKASVSNLDAGKCNQKIVSCSYHSCVSNAISHVTHMWSFFMHMSNVCTCLFQIPPSLHSSMSFYKLNHLDWNQI